MSDAFDSLAIPAAIIFILIILDKAVNGSVSTIGQFINNNLILIYAILFLMAIAITIIILRKRINTYNYTKADHVLYTISVIVTIAQCIVFVVSGLQAALKPMEGYAFIALFGLIGILIICFINAILTFLTITTAYEKRYGFWIPLTIPIVELLLILFW